MSRPSKECMETCGWYKIDPNTYGRRYNIKCKRKQQIDALNQESENHWDMIETGEIFNNDWHFCPNCGRKAEEE